MTDPTSPPPSGPSAGAVPPRACDLILRGGLASALVYPRAITRLARDYRLRHVAGSSAGAIGATVAAAAEFRRSIKGEGMAGFDVIDGIPEEIGAHLIGMFQPFPEFSPLLRGITRVIGGRGGTLRGLATVLAQFWHWIVFGVVVGLGLGAVLLPLLLPEVPVDAAVQGGVGFIACGGILAALLGVAAPLGRILWLVLVRLPQRDFGMCPGVTNPGEAQPPQGWPTGTQPALTDWLHAKVQQIAGRGVADAPLTLAELAPRDQPAIRLRAVTTDLGSHRPYRLPVAERTLMFRVSEFRALFPASVMAHLQRDEIAPRPEPAACGGDVSDFRYLPGDRLPLICLARLSLSFPFLFTTVPLYRIDTTVQSGPDCGKPVRLPFSDGGISSNFPVNFFDNFLPNRPTFGISMADYQGGIRFTEAENAAGLRHRRGDAAGGAAGLPTRPPQGVPGFIMSIIDTAKDWQDSLQSSLPGYADRIVTVYLDDSEGGYNINMPQCKITDIVRYGEAAAGDLAQNFQMDAHRRARLLLEMDALSEAIVGFAGNYGAVPEPGSQGWADFIAGLTPDGAMLTEARRTEIAGRVAALAALGQSWKTVARPDGTLLDIDPEGMPNRALVRSRAHMEN